MTRLLKHIKYRTAAIFAMVAVFASTNEFNEVVNLDEDSPFQSSENTTIDYTINGRLKSRIVASLINQYPDTINNRVEMPEGFEAMFFDSLKEVSSHISANLGTWYKDQELMHARGNVIAYSNNGDTLYTEELFWQQDSAIIYTEQAVKIIKPNMIIYGKGLTADQEFKKYNIKKITGTVTVNE